MKIDNLYAKPLSLEEPLYSDEVDEDEEELIEDFRLAIETIKAIVKLLPVRNKTRSCINTKVVHKNLVLGRQDSCWKTRTRIFFRFFSGSYSFYSS